MYSMQYMPDMTFYTGRELPVQSPQVLHISKPLNTGIQNRVSKYRLEASEIVA